MSLHWGTNVQQVIVRSSVEGVPRSITLYTCRMIPLCRGCIEGWTGQGTEMNESKVLKVLKVLNFWGTGYRRIFTVDSGNRGPAAQYVSFRVAARNLVVARAHVTS